MEHVETPCPLQKVPSKSAITIKRPLRLGGATTFTALQWRWGMPPSGSGRLSCSEPFQTPPKSDNLRQIHDERRFPPLSLTQTNNSVHTLVYADALFALCQIRIAVGDDHSILFYGRVSLYLPLLETGAPFRGKGGLVDSWSDDMDLLFVPTCLNRLTIQVKMSIAHAYSTCRATDRTGKGPADYRDGHRIPVDVVDLCKSLESSPASSTLCFALLPKFG